MEPLLYIGYSLQPRSLSLAFYFRSLVWTPHRFRVLVPATAAYKRKQNVMDVETGVLVVICCLRTNSTSSDGQAV
jgi:hypothetical protein